MKIKKTNKCRYGGIKTSFNGKFVKGCFYQEGGSGFLELKGQYICKGSDYFEESGTHNMRVEDIKAMADKFTNAYKELKKHKLHKVKIKEIDE